MVQLWFTDCVHYQPYGCYMPFCLQNTCCKYTCIYDFKRKVYSLLFTSVKYLLDSGRKHIHMCYILFILNFLLYIFVIQFSKLKNGDPSQEISKHCYHKLHFLISILFVDLLFLFKLTIIWTFYYIILALTRYCIIWHKFYNISNEA